MNQGGTQNRPLSYGDNGVPALGQPVNYNAIFLRGDSKKLSPLSNHLNAIDVKAQQGNKSAPVLRRFNPYISRLGLQTVVDHTQCTHNLRLQDGMYTAHCDICVQNFRSYRQF